MKNIPRIFAGDNIASGMVMPLSHDVAHYLGRVMRRRDFLAFGGGREFMAHVLDDGKSFHIGDQTPHTDNATNITLYFAPIKRTDEMINMATQMGVGVLAPVITEFTVANNINWERMRRIVIEACEQSGRNSVPIIAQPIKFGELKLGELVFADERATRGRAMPSRILSDNVLVGPEGGFSDAEFAALDAAGARGISLGKTILRAELAAVIALDRVMAE